MLGSLFKDNPVPLHHVPYDVCFCEACTDEAQKVNEEPLNPRRSGKPRQRSRRPGKVWETKEGIRDPLGMKSGKYDYYVTYDTPIPTTPLIEIIATGWDDGYSSDDECSPGRVVVQVVETTNDDSEFDYIPIYPEPISI